ncbi:hypothetical protein B0A89_08115 [Paracoccus contaminans]|uniref:AAA domain-containing protein n=1 Tax=Paracoccus contaminans TaxID=1945662 RepID=A0A1W6CXM5_9RHOB|nr:hypothetical protein B0A89_08115 [Paracoccus contaminans]
MDPLVEGEGFAKRISFRKSRSFGVDVIPGDPRLALTEDMLSRDWTDVKASEVRGMKASLVFSELLSRLGQYDYVFVDVGPSLGAINRAVLLSADYFLSPMSIDIFSLRDFENIAKWMEGWKSEWKNGTERLEQKGRRLTVASPPGAMFLGYVSQQYLAKRQRDGELRAVSAYEQIRSRIDDVIHSSLSEDDRPEPPYELGTVPNLFSLIPMSQSKHKPVFRLQGKDGVVGAHFQKVRDSLETFAKVGESLLVRVE